MTAFGMWTVAAYAVVRPTSLKLRKLMPCGMLVGECSGHSVRMTSWNCVPQFFSYE